MLKFNLDIPRIGNFIVYKKRKGFHPIEDLIAKEQEKEGFSKDDAEYVHVEISGGGNESVNSTFPKARVTKIQKQYKGRYIKIVGYKNEEYRLGKRYKVGWFGGTYNNLPYGILSLLWFKINNVVFKNNNILASRHAPFCSFLCAMSLKKVFPESFNNSSVVMPAHFLDMDKFEVIWEGIIE